MIQICNFLVLNLLNAMSPYSFRGLSSSSSSHFVVLDATSGPVYPFRQNKEDISTRQGIASLLLDDVAGRTLVLSVLKRRGGNILVASSFDAAGTGYHVAYYYLKILWFSEPHTVSGDGTG